jgi:hypothetical protein
MDRIKETLELIVAKNRCGGSRPKNLYTKILLLSLFGLG